MNQHSQSRKVIKLNQKQNCHKLSNVKNAIHSSVNSNQQSSDFLKSVYQQNQKQHIQRQPRQLRQLRQPTRSKSKRQQRQRMFSKGKKNQLSCQQILTIAKKRQTHSALDHQHPSISNSNQHSQHGISTNSNRNKGKKKKVKKPTIMMAHKNINHQSGINLNYNLGETSQIMNYPLSRSNSFIVFSDRDTTMNTTFLKSKVASITRGQEANGKCRYKPHQAAILIQKTWRGYLTRKLLEQYIFDQEPKLLEALDNYRSLSNSGVRNDLRFSVNSNSNSPQTSEFERLGEQKNNYLANNVESSFLNTKDINVSDLSSIGQLNLCNIAFNDGFDNSKNLTSTIKRKGQNENKSRLLASLLKTPEENQKQEGFYQSISNQCNIVQANLFKRRKQIQESLPLQMKTQTVSQRNVQGKSQNAKHIKNEVSPCSNVKVSTKSSNNSSPGQTNRDRQFQISKAFQIIINQKIIPVCQMQIQAIFETIQKYFTKVVACKRSEIREQLSKNQMSFEQHIQQSKRIKKLSGFALEKLQQFKEFSMIFKEAIQNLEKPVQTSLNLQTEENKQSVPISVREALKPRSLSKKPTTQVFMIDEESDQSQHYLVHGVSKDLCQINENQSNIDQNYQQQNQQPKNAGYEQLKYYISSIIQQMLECSNQISQLQFLCQLLRRHTETGADNMIQRCLIQFLVQLITGQYQLSDVLKVVDQTIQVSGGQKVSVIYQENSNIVVENETGLKNQSKRQQITQIIERWAKQLNKWNLGVIEEVSHFMESSSFLTQGNDKTLDKDTLKMRLNFNKD